MDPEAPVLVPSMLLRPDFTALVVAFAACWDEDIIVVDGGGD